MAYRQATDNRQEFDFEENVSGADGEWDFSGTEGFEQEMSVDDVKVDENIPMSEEESWAYKILRRATMLKGITIKRDVFLRTELSKRCSPKMIEAAVEANPQAAGVPMSVVDDLADAAISLETRKVSGLSALAGIPGGFAMFGTIPADVVQYFAHVLRIEQKLAYLYGWESFLDDDDEVDDETMYRLILFLGIVMQVGSVNNSLIKFATETAKAGVAKAIEKQALTKTAWYLPLKKVLGVVGVKVTKSSFAEVVSKGVPVVGGIVSGGLTYASFHPGAVSLKKYLRELPQATGVILSEEEMRRLFERIERESKVDYAKALKEAGAKAAEVADVTKDMAGNVAKSATERFKRGFGNFSSKKDASQSEQKNAKPGANDALEQLRALKAMLEEGLITQGDYDAKKSELLGL